MNAKAKNPFQSDKIFVKNKAVVNKSSSRDDLGILALQIACPFRTEIKVEDISANIAPLGKFVCLNLETRFSSGIIFVGTYDDIAIDDLVKKLRDQVYSVIKSANEKIYFLDIIEIEMEPVPFIEILTNVGDCVFLWQLPKVDVIVGYVKLQKKDDHERFESINIEEIENRISDSDLYLYFKKNNRFVHYLKKGGKLDNQRRERLNKRGINNLFVSKDQPFSIQKLRVQSIIEDLLNKYLVQKKAG
jgi:hypothetical protein